MQDLFERFQVLQAGIRSLSAIVQDEQVEPTIEQLTEFAESADDYMIELGSLKSDVIEYFIA